MLLALLAVIATGWALLTLARLLLLAAAVLMVLLGSRPAPQPGSAGVAAGGRAAGLTRILSRSGRRADLLEAMAAAC